MDASITNVGISAKQIVLLRLSNQLLNRHRNRRHSNANEISFFREPTSSVDFFTRGRLVSEAVEQRKQFVDPVLSFMSNFHAAPSEQRFTTIVSVGSHQECAGRR